jgi:hypothetical protein
LPRVIARFEVWVYGELGWELCGGFLDEDGGGQRGKPDAEFVEDDRDEGEQEAFFNSQLAIVVLVMG